MAPKGGWTLVKKSSDRITSKTSSTEQVDEVVLDSEVRGDADVEGSMILGDLEPETGECDPAAPLATTKSSYNQCSIREDAHKIVHGIAVPLLDGMAFSILSLDPFNGFRHRARPEERSSSRKHHDKKEPLSDLERSEKLLRERSIRSNRRHKFIDCLSSQDINIGE